MNKWRLVRIANDKTGEYREVYFEFTDHPIEAINLAGVDECVYAILALRQDGPVVIRERVPSGTPC